MNVKQIATGKRVMGVFEAEYKNSTEQGNETRLNPDGL